MKFKQYLNQLKAKPVQQVRRFVLGNSSVDFDSFFGSIIFAFLLTASTKNFHVPIIDCRREQLKLRFQIWQVLKRLKIEQSTFKFKDSLPLIHPSSFYSLYDHNVRPGIKNVQYIIDHHDYKEPIARKYLISRMGSALTHLYYLTNPKKLCIVASESKDQQDSLYLSKYQRFIENEPFTHLNYFTDQQLELEQIIRYGILLDTFNLDVKQKQRWTIFDQRALQFIESNKQYTFGYKQLQQLKFNNDLNRQLNLQQSLVKDYKKFDYDGFVIEYSIIYLSPKQFYEHYEQDIKERFQQKEQANQIYMLMSLFKTHNNQINREVAFRVRNNDPALLKIVENLLETLGMKKLDQLSNWHCWKDPSATISRKIFDEKFRDYYAQVNKAKEL